jgi:hypothetical protein
MRSLPARSLVVSSLLALALAGCGESRLTVALCEQVHDGNLSKAQGTIEELYGSDSDEALLKHMEKGLVSHLQGDFAASDSELDAAAPLVDDLRGNHVGDAIVSSLYNDTVTTYVGRPFEHTQVDYYRTLNNLLGAQAAEGRWVPPTLLVPGREPLVAPLAVDAAKAYEKAIICARRMTVNQLKETADAADGARYDDDPFARVLAAVSVLSLAPRERTESDQQFATAMLTRALKAYAAQDGTLGKPGNPFRYEVAKTPQVATTLYLRQLKSYDPDFYTTESSRLQANGDVPPGTGSLLVLNHVGLIARPQPLQIGLAAIGFAAPANSTSFNWGAIGFYAQGPGSDIARQWPVLPIPGDVVQKCLAPGGATVIGFELPAHAPDKPLAGPATITAGGVSRTGEVLCDLDAYARSQLKEAQPHVLLKTLLRVAAKQTLVGLGSAAVGKKHQSSEGDLLAFAINLAGSALMTATESADLRAWNTLPDHIEASLIDLPAGTYPLTISTFSGTRDLGTVRIDAGRLTLAAVRTMPPQQIYPRTP